MKIVSKIIANYLKKVMGKLIGGTQSSFILGRQVVDNIILVQEVVHCIRRKIGKKCWIVAKIDPEKAYDRIKWPFLSEVLRQMGFQELMIKLIMNCTTMTTFSVLRNREKLEGFTPSRGIRQGDPLFPYLFILCMEVLGHKIQREVDGGA